MKDKCKKCMCMNCECNNKLHSTDPLNTCYGCDGKDENCTQPMTEHSCLYQARKNDRQ